MQRHVLVARTALIPLLCLAPRALDAQAVCSAPHSSPSLAQGGGIGTLQPGSGWVQLSVYSQQADDRFDHSGERRPFFLSGQTTTRSLYATAAVGVAWGVDVWAQAAVHRLRYADEGGELNRTGLGDVRLAVRASAELFGSLAPVSVRTGVKIPGSSFPVDATVVPLIEGQTDLEVAVETGRAFAGGAVYTLAWGGYCWRLARGVQERDPGNEWFGHAAVGGSRGTFRWEVALEALAGAPPRQLGFELPTDRRRLLQVNPGIALALGPGEVDLGLQVPLVGRNLPSDPAFGAGYRLSW